jgi:hypothetical protein
MGGGRGGRGDYMKADLLHWLIFFAYKILYSRVWISGTAFRGRYSTSERLFLLSDSFQKQNVQRQGKLFCKRENSA